MHIAIIGAGAAGCFAAINIRRLAPSFCVTVFESGMKPLAKVAVTGGGRCNLTNSFNGVRSLAAVYPRGGRLMGRLLREFGNEDLCRWFEREGVRLVTQDDGCVFPRSQDAMEIVNTLLCLMRHEDIRVKPRHKVRHIEKAGSGETADNGFRIFFEDGSLCPAVADIVIITTGGCPKISQLDMLNAFCIEKEPPVPSLFSICLPGQSITDLTGTVVEETTVGIAGTKYRGNGPLLITHLGMSGPAILKMSSYAARFLHDNGYKALLSVNWLGEANETDTLQMLAELAIRNPQKQLSTVYLPNLNSRLWTNLLLQSGCNPETRWKELGRKGMNRLINSLINSTYNIDGKNRFKEEFVTCGGVALSNINPRTLECRTCPNLYFAGEVLDVDAITGGFNLQAAWTMGYIAAKAVADKQAG